MLNHIVIMGRMVRDPELRRTGSGIAVTSFTLAVEDDFKDKDGNRKTNFIDCNAWRGLGEFVGKYFSKGSMAIVSGKLDIREWTDKDGNKRRNAEVVADSVYFGDSKKSSEGNSTYSAPNSYQGSGGDFSDSLALIEKYQKQGGIQSDFAMLEGDDAQLPF